MLESTDLISILVWSTIRCSYHIRWFGCSWEIISQTVGDSAHSPSGPLQCSCSLTGLTTCYELLFFVSLRFTPSRFSSDYALHWLIRQRSSTQTCSLHFVTCNANRSKWKEFSIVRSARDLIVRSPWQLYCLPFPWPHWPKETRSLFSCHRPLMVSQK